MPPRKPALPSFGPITVTVVLIVSPSAFDRTASSGEYRERAGVRRSTVYRHFPDEAALFAACSAHWRAVNPPPDLERWAAMRDPEQRLEAALAEQYRYYRATEGMLANLLRDSATVPIVDELLGRYRGYLGAARDVLMAGRRERGGARRRKQAAVGHALAFATWRSLAREQELGDSEAAELMCRLVAAA
jgi:AcrR family transcriptional regulator